MDIIYTLRYPNGKYTINVVNYLCKSNISNIKELFKTFAIYGDEEKRVELLGLVKDARNYWETWFQKYNKNCNDEECWGKFGTWHYSIMMTIAPRTRPQFRDLIDKINKAIKYLEGSQWTGRRW